MKSVFSDVMRTKVLGLYILGVSFDFGCIFMHVWDPITDVDSFRGV